VKISSFPLFVLIIFNAEIERAGFGVSGPRKGVVLGDSFSELGRAFHPKLDEKGSVEKSQKELSGTEH